MGQPELKTKLDQPKLRQLKQRIAIHSEIAPLKDEEVGAYIDSRLREAGYKGKDLFQTKAIAKIVLYSKGIPRLINTLCDNALLITFAASHKTVSAEVINEAAKDLRLRLEPADNKAIKDGQLASNVDRKVLLLNPHDKPFKRISRPGVRAMFAAFVVILIAILSARSIKRETFPPVLERRPSNQTIRKEVPLPTRQESIAENLDEERVNAPVQTKEVDLRSSDENRIIIPQGTTISRIANDVYGTNAALGMDLIKELNPQIHDLNWISAGQPLVLPTLKGRTLIRQQADGSYRLIISSFFTQTAADQLAREIRKEGYTVVITSNRASTGLLLHRVEIDGLRTIDDATHALETGLKNQWLGEKTSAGNRRTRVDSPSLPTVTAQEVRRSERMLLAKTWPNRETIAG